MFEIREGVTCVNGEIFQTFERDAREEEACFEVEAGTTGFCGGGRDKGGRTYLRITSENADFFARVTQDDNKRPNGIVVAACGDNEMAALLKSLEFAAEVIRDQMLEVDD